MVFIGSALYTAYLFYIIPKDPAQSDAALLVENPSPTSSPAPSPAPVRPAVPIRLIIPTIAVDSIIEDVGLTSGGAMDVPKNASDVGWLSFGPRPGEDGTSVIDGHYGISKGKASAFDDIYKLRKGDIIQIEDQAGAIIPFVVTGNRRYDPQADATYVFGTNQGPSHLNLITCEGVWDETIKGYPERLVVFADKE